MKLTNRLSIALASALFAVAAGTATGDEEMLQPGQPFPTFELAAHDGSTVSNADLEGSPYLLFFYPKADTGG
jgi:peroxiredoxin Q/BCP